jgi:hypothetical protein
MAKAKKTTGATLIRIFGVQFWPIDGWFILSTAGSAVYHIVNIGIGMIVIGLLASTCG